MGATEFPLTQEFVAMMLGATRQTVTVVAGELQKAGLITYQRGKIRIVNRKGLEAARASATECRRTCCGLRWRAARDRERARYSPRSSVVSIVSPRQLLAIGLVCAGGMLVACNVAFDTDLSQTPKYAAVIGAEYRTKVPLYAHGVRDGDKVGSIWVSPYEDPTAPEIAFRRRIPVGHVVRVLSVRKGWVPLENGIAFVVAIDGLDLPPGIDTFIPLYGEMPTTDGFLDQNRFERVRAPAP